MKTMDFPRANFFNRRSSMWKRSLGAVTILTVLAGPAPAEENKVAGPLKALLITGGGDHDYKTLNPVLTKKIGELINVQFEVKSGLETLKNEKFAEGFDVIVYNFCFGGEKDKTIIDNALKATRDGKPTLMIHCAMHTFQASDEWTDCCGMRTRSHDNFAAFSIIKADKEHPIVKTLPDDWKTPGDELYQTIKLGERSTALLKGKNTQTNSEHVVCWTSTYGKGTVFATTLGHDMKTVGMPEYHQLLAHGLLWA